MLTALIHRYAKQREMNMKPKYQLSNPNGGFFYRDDAQLRRAFRPWLPCKLLWKMATWWYYHA